jgi:hypothetical protein
MLVQYSNQIILFPDAAEDISLLSVPTLSNDSNDLKNFRVRFQELIW